METEKILELKNKLEELKDNYKQYKENTEDGVDKDKTLRKMQIKVGQHIKKLVLLLKEEGYTTLEIAEELDIPEKQLRE